MSAPEVALVVVWAAVALLLVVFAVTLVWDMARDWRRSRDWPLVTDRRRRWSR